LYTRAQHKPTILIKLMGGRRIIRVNYGDGYTRRLGQVTISGPGRVLVRVKHHRVWVQIGS